MQSRAMPDKKNGRRSRSRSVGRKKIFFPELLKSGMTPKNWGKSAVPGGVGKKCLDKKCQIKLIPLI